MFRRKNASSEKRSWTYKNHLAATKLCKIGNKLSLFLTRTRTFLMIIISAKTVQAYTSQIEKNWPELKYFSKTYFSQADFIPEQKRSLEFLFRFRAAYQLAQKLIPRYAYYYVQRGLPITFRTWFTFRSFQNKKILEEIFVWKIQKIDKPDFENRKNMNFWISERVNWPIFRDSKLLNLADLIPISSCEFALDTELLLILNAVC